MVQGRYSSPEPALHQGLRGLGLFGSGAVRQFTPSMVLSTALAVAGVASPSPSHVDQASSSRIAGMRGSSSWDLIVRRMSSLAGTVAMTQASMGAGRSETSNRRHTKAKPRVVGKKKV